MDSRFKMCLSLGALAAIPPISTDLYVSGFPVIGADFGVSATQVQLSLTASLLGIACGQIFIGPLSDVYGRKRPLLCSLAVFLLASLGCALAFNITQFIILRFVQGLAGSGGVVLSRAIAYDNYRGRELTEFIALIMVITGVAPILAPVLGGQLITHFGWQSVFFFLTFCAALLFADAWLLPESLLPAQRVRAEFSVILKSFAGLLRNKAYTACLSVHCLVIGGLFAYISASPFILQGLYGLSPVEYSICFAINGLGMMLAAKTASRFIIEIDEQKQLRLTMQVYTAIGALLLAASVMGNANLWTLLVCLFIFAACIGIGECNSFSLAMQNITGNAGSASGLLGIGSFLLGALMTPLVSLGGKISLLPLAIIVLATGCLSLIALKYIPSPERD